MRHSSLLGFMLFAAIVFGQEKLLVKYSCSFDGEAPQTEYYTFEASETVSHIVEDIVTSLSMEQF